jgi:hypothetical protein
MTTYTITGTQYYSALSPAPVANTDTIDQSNDSTYIVDVSTVPILIHYCDNQFQTARFENASTTVPIFPRYSSVSSSFINGGGNFEFAGEFIDLFTADGVTPNLTQTLPLDAAGAAYAHASHVVIDGVIWARVPNLTDMYGDFRGMHYMYDGVKLIFGDGTNGMIPSGLAQIYNIELQGNNVQFNHANSITTVSKALWCDVDLRAGGQFIADHFAIYNNAQPFLASSYDNSTLTNFGYSGDASNNTRFTTPPGGTHDKIRFTTCNTSVTEVVSSDGVATTLAMRCDFVNERASNFPRVRMDNDGSTIQELSIYGGRTGVYRSFDGVNGGTIETLRWSTGYLRTYTIPYAIVWAQGLGQNQYINNVIRDGSEAWSGEMEAPLYGDSGNIHVKNMNLPADAQVDELARIFQGCSGSLNGVEFLGTATSGNRDINNFTNVGFQFSNIRVPNDTDFGNQPAINSPYNFVSCIGHVFSPGAQMRSSIIYKNATYTSGEIVFQPFYQANVDYCEVLSGSGSRALTSTNRFYLADTVTKLRIESDWLAGVEAINTLTLGGANTGNFDIEFRLKVEGDAYPASYTTLTLGNYQTAFAALTLPTTSTRWKTEYTIIRTAGVTSTSYISGIYIGCDIDPSYVWVDAPEMTVTFTGLTVGWTIYLADAAGNQKFYFTATGATDVIEVSGLDDGQTYSYAVDTQGKTADVGTFTVVSGGSLIIPVVLGPLTRLGGAAMYTGTTDANISIEFDFVTPQASIVIVDNNEASLQTCIDMCEDALITADGMKWHTLQGSIVVFDSIAASGSVLGLGDNWRLKNSVANATALGASVDGYVTSTQQTVLDADNGKVTYSPAGVADSILSRNLAGGSDGGRTVRDALRGSRNKVAIINNTMTVYQEDDATVAWTADLDIATRGAINTVDPT